MIKNKRETCLPTTKYIRTHNPTLSKHYTKVKCVIDRSCDPSGEARCLGPKLDAAPAINTTYLGLGMGSCWRAASRELANASRMQTIEVHLPQGTLLVKFRDFESFLPVSFYSLFKLSRTTLRLGCGEIIEIETHGLHGSSQTITVNRSELILHS
jgi:hypothetical protein